MKLCTDLLENNADIALAIGFFDGVHIAHKKVISNCVNYAKEHNLKSAVLTFCEHPCIHLWNVSPSYIISKKQRINFIENLGVDILYMIDFSSDLSNMSSNDFLMFLNKTLAPQAIFTGFNFYFGKNKSGSTQTLKINEEKFNYEYFELEEQKINNVTISSTNIKNFLKDGNILLANRLLGYEFNFSSSVIKGQQIGRTFGIPTANLVYPKTLVPLKFGVYSSKIKLNGIFYDGIMNFGLKPTVSDSVDISVEVNILNFNEDIYSQNITVYPQKFIREQKKFDSLEALKNQIFIDISKMYNS